MTLSEDDLDRIARAVVRIVAVDAGADVSSGSGTLIHSDGVILTNRHVIVGAEDFRVEMLEDPNEPPVPRYRARVSRYSSDADFAVLRIDRDDRGRPLAADAVADVPLVSPSSEDARRGAVVFVFGYPALGDGYLSTNSGNITIVRNGAVRGQRLPEWYLTDAELAPGNSGGLAVNARGEMIGIPTRIRRDTVTGGRLAWILPLGVIRAEVSAGLEVGPFLTRSP